MKTHVAHSLYEYIRTKDSSLFTSSAYFKLKLPVLKLFLRNAFIDVVFIDLSYLFDRNN